ncbi:MAG: DUF3299 domain-containing protein [Blastopirellula sp. JB062]
MTFRRSIVAFVLLFCAACTPSTPEGVPYASNMTGLNPVGEEGAIEKNNADAASSDQPPPNGKQTAAEEPIAPAVEKENEKTPAAQEEPSEAEEPTAMKSPVEPPKPSVENTPTASVAATPSDGSTASAATSKPGSPRALEPDKTLPRKPGVQDLTFDDIAFEMEKGDPFTRSLLPPRIEELGNQKIRIRGYILPSFESRGIKQFVLVRDNMECCFGPGAALYDCILVEMKGPGVDFTVRPVTVEGVFEIEEYKGPDGKHLAIYRMEGESAK